MQERIKFLVETLENASALYYGDGTSPLTDEEFDKFEHELRALDPNNKHFDTVGGTETGTVRHTVPMLSLAKEYDPVAVTAFYKTHGALIATPKIDGCATSLRYRDGVFIQAITRGRNGEYGEDITENTKLIPDIPKQIGLIGFVEVRGEINLPLSNFKKLESLKSPRNAVAGMLSGKTNRDQCKYLGFLAYDILDTEQAAFTSEKQKLNTLNGMRFQTVDWNLVDSPSSVMSTIQYWEQKRDSLDYNIDGVVFKINDCAKHKELGSNSHHPRWAKAFKWASETAVTPLTNIEFATSRNGLVKPTGIVKPVFLSDARITRVTLHNADHIKRHNLSLDTEIEITRSGEVIPKFLKVVKASEGDTYLPTHCPSCNTQLSWKSVDLYCNNSLDCPAQGLSKIVHYAHIGRIDSVGESILEALYDKGLVVKIEDLYDLKQEDMLKLDRIGITSANKVIKNIQASKRMKAVTYLQALGINSVGRGTSKDLIEYFKTVDKVFELEVNDILKMPGYQIRSASEIVKGLWKLKSTHEALVARGLDLTYETVEVKGTKLVGLAFVITGTFSKDRKELEKDIIAQGGQVSSGVSSKTSYLLAGDKAGSKLDKAKKLGVKVLTEEEFNNLLK